MGISGNLTRYLSMHKHFVIVFFIIFYVVGIVGMTLPISQPLFIKLVPLALLLSLIAILLYHQPAYDSKTLLVFSFIAVSGYLIEVIGVNTGLGHYEYGGALGIKIFNTPLLIGLNWLLLMYAGHNVIEKLKLNGWLGILMASLIVLLYDFILERIAPVLDMWQWENELVPVQNYIAWFLMTFLFLGLLKVARVKTTNPLVFLIVLMQAVFFLVLLIVFNATKL